MLSGILQATDFADWDVANLNTRGTDVDKNGVYLLRLTDLLKGEYLFKVAMDSSWTINYGLHGSQSGADVPLNIPADSTPVTLLFDSLTKHVDHSINSVIIAVGSFNAWDTSSLDVWLQVTGG